MRVVVRSIERRLALTFWTIGNFTRKIITSWLSATGCHFWIDIRLTEHDDREENTHTFARIGWEGFQFDGMIANKPLIVGAGVFVLNLSHVRPKQCVTLTSRPNTLMRLQEYYCVGWDSLYDSHIFECSLDSNMKKKQSESWSGQCETNGHFSDIDNFRKPPSDRYLLSQSFRYSGIKK